MEAFSLTFPDQCPKCMSLSGWTVAYRAPESHSQDYDVPGDRDWFHPEHLEVLCLTCGYSYEMRTADDPDADARR